MLKRNGVRIAIANDIEIEGLTEAQEDRIKEQLTFDNPQYAQVMKYSKWSSTNVPKYLMYYRAWTSKSGKRLIRVPLGYRLPKNILIKDSVDMRADVTTDIPDFKMTLRQTQQEALEKYLDSAERIPLCSTVQLPTGKGKTILGLAIAHRLQAKTLIVVHKTDLVTGWKADIVKAFDGKADVGIIKAKSRSTGRHFTIATIQTLNRLPKEQLADLYNSFGLVIQDEMHHCPSSTFSLVNNFNCKYRLGLTATPERNDGLTHVMHLFFGDICYKYEHTADDTDILPVQVIRRSVSTYFNPICRLGITPKNPEEDERTFNPLAVLKANECRITELDYFERGSIPHLLIDGAVVNHPDTYLEVCDDIKREYQQGHSCIVFLATVESVDHYKEILVRYGVPEEDIGLYYGKNRHCDKVLEKAESKRAFITLATYSKATEGTNVKQWEVGFLVSSVNNGKSVEQAVGRIRRITDKPKLEKAVLYDYRYPQVYTLSGHGATRDSRYTKLKFIGAALNKRSLFTRGYNK